jgi:hypothetical protein
MTGEVGSPIYCPGGFSLADCEVNDRDELWVCNNSFTSPGIRIFHALTGAPLAGPLPTGLPPFSITFDETGNVVADAGDPGSNPSLSAPRPNPARGDVSFALALASSARVRLDAFDLSGRRVRAILDETRAAGSSVMRWDLTDERGARVAAGIYFVRADVNGRARVRRVVVLER